LEKAHDEPRLLNSQLSVSIKYLKTVSATKKEFSSPKEAEFPLKSERKPNSTGD
jgi:hypothetical protein